MRETCDSSAYRTRQLAVRLSVFFSLHDRTMLDTGDRIAGEFVDRPKDLDNELKRDYGYDLEDLAAYRPSAQEQRDKIHDLAVRLCLFFSIHEPSMLANVGLIARSFAHDARGLNEALTLRYGCDVQC